MSPGAKAVKPWPIISTVNPPPVPWRAVRKRRAVGQAQVIRTDAPRAVKTRTACVVTATGLVFDTVYVNRKLAASSLCGTTLTP